MSRLLDIALDGCHLIYLYSIVPLLSCITFTFLIIVSGWIHHFILVLIILMVPDCLHIFRYSTAFGQKFFRSKAVTWWNSLPCSLFDRSFSCHLYKYLLNVLLCVYVVILLVVLCMHVVLIVCCLLLYVCFVLTAVADCQINNHNHNNHNNNNHNNLDTAVYAPLKTNWQDVCHCYLQSHPGMVITKYQFSQLFQKHG